MRVRRQALAGTWNYKSAPFGRVWAKWATASELAYPLLEPGLVTAGEPLVSSKLTGAVNVLIAEVAGVVAGTAVGAWRTDQVTHCSACPPTRSLKRGSEPGVGRGVVVGTMGCLRSLEQGQGRGPIAWTAHISLAARRLRASEAGGAGTGPERTSSRTWKVRGGQACLRTRAAGVQLKFKHSGCL